MLRHWIKGCSRSSYLSARIMPFRSFVQSGVFLRYCHGLNAGFRKCPLCVADGEGSGKFCESTGLRSSVACLNSTRACDHSMKPMPDIVGHAVAPMIAIHETPKTAEYQFKYEWWSWLSPDGAGNKYQCPIMRQRIILLFFHPQYQPKSLRHHHVPSLPHCGYHHYLIKQRSTSLKSVVLLRDLIGLAPQDLSLFYHGQFLSPVA